MNSGDNRNLKFLVEFAGASAVLVGLIFVGLELRQNTAAVEASTLQNLTDTSVDYVVLLGSDPDLTRIWLVGQEDPDQLTDIESIQLNFLIRGQWLRFQNAFLQWQRGTLNDDDWELYKGYVCAKTAAQWVQAEEHIRFTSWASHRVALLSPFVEYVENCWSDDNPIAN